MEKWLKIRGRNGPVKHIKVAAMWKKDENKIEPTVTEQDDKGRIIPSARRRADGNDTRAENTPRRRGVFTDHPTVTEATRLFNVSRRKIDTAGYVFRFPFL